MRQRASVFLFFFLSPVDIPSRSPFLLVVAVASSLELSHSIPLFTAEVLLGGCRILNLDPEKAVVDGVDDEEL